MNRWPLLAGMAMAVLAVILFLELRWDAPIVNQEPSAPLAIGPFRSGESFEQQFLAPADFVSRLEIAVKAEFEGNRETFDVLLRLYDGQQIVREGVVKVDVPRGEPGRVMWSFDPIPDSAGRLYRIQVVIGEQRAVSIFAMATVKDTLPGSIISNGIPSGSHIDLFVVPGRSLGALGILRVVGRISGLGWIWMGGALAALGAVGGIGLGLLRGPVSPRVVVSWAAVGAGLAALAFSLSANGSANRVAAEMRPIFWLGVTGMPAALLATAWSVYLSGRLTGRLQAWRDSTISSRLPVAAVTMTLAAVLVYLVTKPAALIVGILVIDGGRPFPGRLPLLDQEPASELFSAALFLWTAHAATGAWSGRSRRQRILAG